jgi:hypothetical protein
MTTRILVILALLAAVPGWSQATGTATEQAETPVANDGMMTPPPVSGQAFPVATGAEVRNNYVNVGVTAGVAYDDNVEAGYSPTPESDTIYSIWPTITLDRSSVRLREIFNYSPGFSFYQPNTIFNESDQNASVNLQYLFTEHASISLQDAFVRSSSLFDSPFGTGLGDVTGAPPTQATGAIAAFADRISNAANVQLSDQTGENGLFGVAGQYGQLDYPDSSQVPGLYNSTSWNGTAFVSQRLNARQYLGGEVQHARIVSYLKGALVNGIYLPLDNAVQRDNIFGFYTIYLRNSQKSTLSLSVTGGPEHYTVAQYPEALLEAWAPSGTLTLGWQAHRSSFSASYMHAVTAGGGLPGAYKEDSAHANFRRQLTPTWDVNFSGLYARNTNLTPTYAFSEPGGHTYAASVSAEHMITKNMKCQFGYDWMDESYTGIGALAKLPKSNREYGSISYLFSRPIGR